MTNRRDFLKTSLAGTGLVAWGLSVPTFLARTARAAHLE
jgi:anaerobic selenocysteine-containing dehydrogenase